MVYIAIPVFEIMSLATSFVKSIECLVRLSAGADTIILLHRQNPEKKWVCCRDGKVGIRNCNTV